jgi:hypothetical protein
MIRLTLTSSLAILLAALPPFPPQFAPDLALNTPATIRGSFNPVVARSGSDVYAAWVDQRNGTTDIYFRASHDSGATWGNSDLRINHNPPGVAYAAGPQLLVQNGTVYVVWSDTRKPTGGIYLNYSTDGGLSWRPKDLRLDENKGGGSGNPVICGSDDTVYVAWFDYRNGTPDIYFNRSVNGGAKWLGSDVRLTSNHAGLTSAQYPSIACNGSQVYCAWDDDRNGFRDIYFNYSTDAGKTWHAERRLETDAPGAGDSGSVRLTAAGSNVYAVWEDNRTSIFGIYFNRSTDGGATWQASETQLNRDVAANTFAPSIACEGGMVYVAWSDRRNVAPELGNEDIYFNRSNDAGATWLAQDVRINTAPAGSASAEIPSVACSQGRVFVAWTDERNGTPDAMLNASADGGDTWLPSDIRLNSNPTGTGAAFYPLIISRDGGVDAIWEDHRDVGTGDTFYRRSIP